MKELTLMLKFSSLLILLTVATAWAGSKATLPKALLEARTAYVQNDSWHSSVGDECSDELSKWGRFKLVGDHKQADLVFHVSGSIYNRTTLVVTDPSTRQELWSSKPDKPRRAVNELRKRIEEHGRQASK
jgi:hypothetical protein